MAERAEAMEAVVLAPVIQVTREDRVEVVYWVPGEIQLETSKVTELSAQGVPLLQEVQPEASEARAPQWEIAGTEDSVPGVAGDTTEEAVVVIPVEAEEAMMVPEAAVLTIPAAILQIQPVTTAETVR